MPENEVATRRGRKLPRDQRVRRLKRLMIQLDPRLDEAKYGPLITSFAEVTLLSRDAFDFLRQHGLTNEDGELRSSLDTFQRLLGQQLKFAKELGLSPSALGKVRGEKPADLVAAFAHRDEEHAEQA